MVDRDIGRDVANVVLDVQHVERTERDTGEITPGQRLVIKSHNVVLVTRWAIKSEAQAHHPSFIELRKLLLMASSLPRTSWPKISRFTFGG